jgi:sulfate adenylyltransferase subunit 1 (EFTu-like GTPase family)
VDTNTARLIVLAPSGASELDGPSRAVTTVKHSTKGGWGSLGYQRHVDTETARFAEEVAEAIEATMAARRLHHLVLAGDEVIVPALTRALSAATRERLDVAEHVDIREGVEAVAERAWPEVAQLVQRRRDDEVAAIAGRVAAGRDAEGEPTTVIEALRAGRVDTLALDADRVEEAVAELALREALTHRSRVLVVRGHEALAWSGGLAATLR